MHRHEPERSGADGQQGFVLIMIALLVLPLLLLAGSAMTFLNGSGKLTREAIDQSCALEAVESAVDFAIYRANCGAFAGGTTSGSGTLSNGATWAYTAVNMSTDTANNDLDGLTDEADEQGYQITATGTYRKAKRRVIAYVANRSLPVVEGAVSVEDPNAILNINGNSFTMSGEDHNLDGSLSGNPPVYGATVNDPGTTANLLSMLTSGQQNRITGTGLAPSAAVTSMSFDDAFNALRPIAHNIIPGGSYVTVPNMGNYATNTWRVTYCTGSLTVTGNQVGAGILVVNGDLTFIGTLEYVGIVMVLGNVRFGGGGAAKMIRGALLINGDASVGDVFGVNGTVDIQYSAIAIAKARDMTNRWVIAGWREIAR